MESVTDNQTSHKARSDNRNAYVACSLNVVGLTISGIVNRWSSFHGFTCGLCGKPIEDIVYRGRVTDSSNFRRKTTVCFCSDCFKPFGYHNMDCFKHTCEVCGKTVYAIKFNGTCGENCRQHRRYDRHHNKLLSSRESNVCEVCGIEITETRTDSRYCSSKCRQKAYRQRKSETC